MVEQLMLYCRFIAVGAYNDPDKLKSLWKNMKFLQAE
jgi:hypothetical protein